MRASLGRTLGLKASLSGETIDCRAESRVALRLFSEAVCAGAGGVGSAAEGSSVLGCVGRFLGIFMRFPEE